MSDERLLWAKASPSYKSLWHHMIDSGFCAARLAEDPRFLCGTQLIAAYFDIEEQQAIDLVAYLAAMHDCYGKAHPAFQKSPSKMRQPLCNPELFRFWIRNVDTVMNDTGPVYSEKD